MRQNQQFKRSRGRNNNRKFSNPLSRSFESNGPDVKIRGNAAQIAEKYLQLARDAQASGDSVMEQNYLQHAEHYQRLVVAAQAQNQARQQASEEAEESRDESQNAEQPAAEKAKGASEPSKSADNAETAAGDAEAAPKPRRARRKPRAQGDKADPKSQDPGDAPQPDLPAFITAEKPADAAE